MLGFVVRQLRYRRGRVATLAAGILVAAASFVLLTSAAQTSELQVKGTVAKNFRAAYDILVRPKNSFTRLEKQQGLIRENYLSGIFGGITMKQFRQIKKIRGVDVAAPIANIGYLFPMQPITVNIYNDLTSDPYQLYRLRFEWIANHGASTYPDADQYVYFTRRDRLAVGKTTLTSNGLQSQYDRDITPQGRSVPACNWGLLQQQAKHGYSGPFALQNLRAVWCFSSRSSNQILPSDQFPRNPRVVGALTFAFFPILVSAVDPVAEAKLVGLNRAMVSGRYLKDSDRPVLHPHSHVEGVRTVPVIASTRAYVGETLRVGLQRLDVPNDPHLPRRLANPYRITNWLASLRGPTITTFHRPLTSVYRKFVSELRAPIPNEGFSDYWITSPNRYKVVGPNTLRPRTSPLDPGQLQTGNVPGWAPQEMRDPAFRRIELFSGSSHSAATTERVVGTFDTTKLPGFNPLSAVPLETYYPPRVAPANRASRRALHGQDLLPTRSITGYIAQPPFMLTTLHGAKAFRQSANLVPGDTGQSGAGVISVIRVRVAGVTGADRLSRERIKGVAAAIHRQTGLAVDITAGSSPHPMLIDLPKGKFGQPPLTVREGWVEKGVAVRFLDAVDKKSLFLFSLILVVCGLFLANAALASVRARRTEIGTLLTLGWSRASIFRAIVAELALVGALAGIAGTVLALITVPLLSLHISLLRTLLVAPVAVVIAIIAGLLPAWRAARGRPMDALSPPVTGGDHRRHVSHILGMALANTARIPARTLVAITGLVFGVAALTVLIALNRALQGTLVGTLMGHFISSQIRG
ncbi:MAG: hypothetical protein M3P18_00475, partial [Actinomycetota bacterium]|nr:hypothetical protein [Actinomycetota bacterium]